MSFFRRRQSETEPATPPTAAPADSAATGHVSLPGISLHYATWGAPNPARATLLIHGLTASHKEWTLLGPALAAEGSYVIAPDLRGRGLSAKPAQGYGVSFHAADLVALCDALGLGTVDMVGHSLGAVIGMYMAAVYPQRVRRLVMVDAGGNIPEDTAQAIAASVSRLGTVYPSLDAYLGLMRQLPMLQWNDLWEAYFRYDADVRPDGTVTSRVPKAAIEEESLALGLTRSEALPDLVRAPTLLVRATVGLLGPDRGLILPRAEAERLQGIIPSCQLIEIEGTNHYTVVTVQPFVESVRAFLAKGT
jgi:pimeloyl-ACP methyl ester carboxylesterase